MFFGHSPLSFGYAVFYKPEKTCPFQEIQTKVFPNPLSLSASASRLRSVEDISSIRIFMIKEKEKKNFFDALHSNRAGNNLWGGGSGLGRLV